MMRGGNWLAAAGLALALAGCDTVSTMTAQPIAELDTASAAEASVNIGSLTEVINRNPNDPGAYNTRGAAYARVGRFSDAIADFTKAVQLDPNLASAYTNRGLALRQSGRNDAALADFNKATSVAPNYAPAFIARANLLRAQGNSQQALADLNVAIRLNPESAEAFHARGLVYQREGQHQYAISDFDSVIDRNPYNAPPYIARGQSLNAIGKYDSALEDFTAALNVDNRSADAWAGRGFAQEKLGSARKPRRAISARSGWTATMRPRAPGRAVWVAAAGSSAADHSTVRLSAAWTDPRVASATNRRISGSEPWAGRSSCPPFGKRRNRLGALARPNSASPWAKGITRSRSPCSTSSGALTRSITASERKLSSISQATGT